MREGDRIEIPILCRALIFIALGWVMLTTGVRWTHGHSWSAGSPEPGMPLDRELLRCAELGPLAAADPDCNAATTQSRIRFFRPERGQDFCSSCDPGGSRLGK
jgi:conjugative transfer region protein TrbK